MDRLYAADLPLLAPELTLVILAVILTVIDLFLRNETDRRFLGWISVIGLGVAWVLVVSRYGQPYQQLLGDSYRIDDYASLFKTIFLTAAILVTLLAISYVRKMGSVESGGELYYLIVAATLGAMMMASSTDLVTLFVALELLSISSYILVGTRKNNMLSNEAAFKYIVLGGIASAMLLFGMSYLYGLTGTTNLLGIGKGLANLTAGSSEYNALIYVAFFFLLAGFGFKIGMAPFHMWTPDVYQGAPTPITAFLTSVSKAAAIAMTYRTLLFLMFSNAEAYSDFTLYIAVAAATTMIIGNTVALRQTNAKRLMAYSSIANAGYLLVPLVSFTGQSFAQMIYYLTAYVLMNIGVLALIMALSKGASDEDTADNGDAEAAAKAHESEASLDLFAGLYHRAPMISIGMTVLVLSLAGIPITAGFFGKFYILWSAVSSERYWLAALMILTSVISFFYYFGFIRQMYMRPGIDTRIRIPAITAIVFWFTVVATVALAVYPNGVLDLITNIFTIQEDWLGVSSNQ